MSKSSRMVVWAALAAAVVFSVPARAQSSEDELKREAVARVVDSHDPALSVGIGRVYVKQAALNTAIRDTLTAVTLLGLLLVGLAAPRRSAFLGSVPLSFLALQSPLHFEFRVTLPMHAVLFLFAAGGLVLIAGGLWAALAPRSRRAGAGVVAG